MRAWSAQNVAEQPRLLQWTYKAFAAAAAMGFPISVCRYLLHPGSDLHNAILEHMPGEIRLHWQEILKARGGEAVRILESTRNRLDPFFESPNLRYMFGVSENRFDCSRFIQDRRIVIFNLAKLQRLPGFVADTIGSLVLNEIFETAVGLTTTVGKNFVDPTYILLDEFQKYVSQDIEDALPTVRQMGLRLILAHQSFAQLQTEAIDLEQMIWQARMRLMFASNAKDADLLADEIAKLTFDSRRVKEVRKSRRQLIAGYESRWTRSESNSSTSSSSDARQQSESEGDSQSIGGKAGEWFGVKRETNSSNKSLSMSISKTHAESTGKAEGRSETLVPIHDNFEEVSNIDYYSFEEQSLEWGKRLRSQRTGEAILQLPNQSGVQPVKIDYFELENTPETEERIQRMVEANFASEFFMPIAEAEARHERCLQDLLAGKLRTIPPQLLEAPREMDGNGKDSPFSL